MAKAATAPGSAATAGEPAPPRVRLDIIDQIVIYVEEFESSLRFYRDVLGLPLRFVHEDWAEFGTRGTGLALQPGGKRSVSPKDFRKNGFLPTIRVQSVESAVAFLRSKGVKVTEIRQEALGRLAVFCDPEGNQLQLVEPHE